MRKKYEEPSMQVVILELEVITLVSGGEFTANDSEVSENPENNNIF